MKSLVLVLVAAASGYSVSLFAPPPAASESPTLLDMRLEVAEIAADGTRRTLCAPHLVAGSGRPAYFAMTDPAGQTLELKLRGTVVNAAE